MKTRLTTSAMTAFVLVLAAGTVVPAQAQTRDTTDRRDQQERRDQPVRRDQVERNDQSDWRNAESRDMRDQDGMKRKSSDYRAASWMTGLDVVNNTGDNIGSISDLVLDRGSGRIEYAVLKSGGILGLGARSVLIPFKSFSWDQRGEDKLVLAATPEQLKAMPEFSDERWESLNESSENDQDEFRRSFSERRNAPSDPYTRSLGTTQPERIEGEITKVERDRTNEYGEHVIVTVKTDDGQTKRVALGPSWYVNSTSAAPIRGERVSVDAIAMPSDPNQTLVATNLQAGERQLRLRGEDRSPSWSSPTMKANGRTYGAARSQFVLLSDIDGMDVECRGEESGKVDEIVIDRNSGVVAFLSVDPDENFMGMMDTKRLLPWEIATIAVDDTIRLDATKEMVLASMETPDDLTTLNDGVATERAYRAFGVEAPRHDSWGSGQWGNDPSNRYNTDRDGMNRDGTRRDAMDRDGLNRDGTRRDGLNRDGTRLSTDDPWSARGSILSGLDHSTSKNMTGEITDITEVEFDDGGFPAHAIKVRAQRGGTEETIILGPTWYIKNQNAMCEVGEVVNLEVCRTTVNGKEHWLARSITCNGNRLELIDAESNPVWSRP